MEASSYVGMAARLLLSLPTWANVLWLCIQDDEQQYCIKFYSKKVACSVFWHILGSPLRVQDANAGLELFFGIAVGCNYLSRFLWHV